MGELFKREDTIDELLESMGVQIVLDGNTLSEKDKEEIKKNGEYNIFKRMNLYKFILFDCNHSINCYKHRIQNEVIRL